MSNTKKGFSPKQLRIIRFGGVLIFIGSLISVFFFTGNDRFLKRCIANGNTVKYCNDIYEDRKLAFKEKELEPDKKKKKKNLELAGRRRKELELANQKIKELEIANARIKELELANQKIKELERANQKIKELEIANARIKELELANQKIKELERANQKIKELERTIQRRKKSESKSENKGAKEEDLFLYKGMGASYLCIASKAGIDFQKAIGVAAATYVQVLEGKHGGLVEELGDKKLDREKLFAAAEFQIVETAIKYCPESIPRSVKIKVNNILNKK